VWIALFSGFNWIGREIIPDRMLIRKIPVQEDGVPWRQDLFTDDES
jgi:hypothetical protein